MTVRRILWSGGSAGRRTGGINRRAIATAAAALLAGADEARAEFVSAPVTTAHTGLPYHYDITATGNGYVHITAPNGLPSWLVLEPTGSGTATLSGTPSAADTGAGITLRSEDTACRIFLIRCYRYQFFDIAILQNSPPVVVPPGIEDQSALEGRPFNLAVAGTFEDPDGDALTYTVTGLPAGWSFTGSEIVGTPTSAGVTGSPYSVRVAADDGRGGTAETRFSLALVPLQRADLRLTSIEAAPSPGLSGEPVEWSFEVGNDGPSASESAELTIVLAGSEISLEEHACSAETQVGRQTLVCPLPPIEDGDIERVTLSAAAPEAGDVYVTAEVAVLGERSLDPDLDNNHAARGFSIASAVNAEPAQQLSEAGVAAAAGDVDGDGFDDLVVAAEAAPGALHLNLEDPASLHPALADSPVRRGLSTVPMSLGDAAARTSAALADFDNDADLDLALGGESGSLELFANDGTAVMTPWTTAAAEAPDTRALKAADLDGDGAQDLVVANAETDFVLLNQGGGSFARVPLEVRASIDVEAIDVDGNGSPDLVFAHEDGHASIHLNAGQGERFDAPLVLETGPTSAVASGDFDGDGYPDLVFARLAPDPSGLPSNPVYLNDGRGGFAEAVALGATPTLDVLVSDFDGDARLDIVAVNASGIHQIYAGDSDGLFRLRSTVLAAPGAKRAVAARIGLRDATDLVFTGSDGTVVFFNDGHGQLGLGDTSRPVIELIGEAEIELEVEGRYEDPGATATDDVDGALTPDVDNPVDTKVIGTYTVTYTATDGAGNAAEPVMRTVRVEAREASGGGGGGAAGAPLLLLVAAALTVAVSRRAALRSR